MWHTHLLLIQREKKKGSNTHVSNGSSLSMKSTLQKRLLRFIKNGDGITKRDVLKFVKKKKKKKVKPENVQKKKKRRGKAYAPTNEEWTTWLAFIRTRTTPSHFLCEYLARICAERCGAIVQLRVEDINLDIGEIHVPKQIQKGGESYAKDRIIYLDEDNRVALQKIKNNGLSDKREFTKQCKRFSGKALELVNPPKFDFKWPESGYLFNSYKEGRHMNPVSHGNVIRKLRKELVNEGKVEFARMTTHSARRSAATALVQEGYDSSIAMQITGHSSLKGFQEYVTCNQNVLRRAIQKINTEGTIMTINGE